MLLMDLLLLKGNNHYFLDSDTQSAISRILAEIL